MIDRVFSAKTRSAILSCWLFIFCLSASVIAGGDYRSDNAENTPVNSQKDDSWIVNAQTVITLAPGIYVIPEVGYYYLDGISSNDQGHQWYVGVKWQIDFWHRMSTINRCEHLPAGRGHAGRSDKPRKESLT